MKEGKTKIQEWIQRQQELYMDGFTATDLCLTDIV